MMAFNHTNPVVDRINRAVGHAGIAALVILEIIESKRQGFTMSAK